LPYSIAEGGASEAAALRQAIGVDIVGDPAGEDATPAPVESFEEMGVLPYWLLDALRAHEAIEPTPLQAQALPIVLAGQNLVAISRSGSGQAVAIAAHAAVHADDQAPLSDTDPGPIVLVLVPTQEMAARVAEEASHVFAQSHRGARHGALRCVNVSGGGSRAEKLRELSAAGAHMVIGTPKRVLDIAGKEQMSLLRVTLLALEGTDRMIDLGFAGELRQLASWTRPERQTVIFAATWPKALADVANELCFSGGPPVHINVSAVSAPARRPAPAGAAAAAKGVKRPLPAQVQAEAPAKSQAKAGAPAAKVGKKAEAKAQLGEEFPDDW